MRQIPLETNWLLEACNHLSEIVKGSGITNIDINGTFDLKIQ